MDDIEEIERLKFFGAICASITHELNNTLTILDQLNGLITDQMAASEDGSISADRIETTCTKMINHIQRGVETVGRLNRFAHNADNSSARFDAGELIANFTVIVRRIVERCRLIIEFVDPLRELKFTGNPYDIQRLLFIYIQWFMKTSVPGKTIKIIPFKDESLLKIDIIVNWQVEEELIKQREGQPFKLLGFLGGKDSFTSINNETRLRVTLPELKQ